MTKVDLDDLPKYSPWPERLLGIKPWDVHYKNPAEIEREYGREKWEAVHKRLLNEPLTLSELESEGAKTQMVGFTNESGFLLAESKWWQERKLDLYENTIRRVLGNGRSILELGGGYGSVILPLAARFHHKLEMFGAGEYTNSGLSAMRLLIERQKENIRSGHCDFFTLSCDDSLAELPKPIIFTSVALMYVPKLSVGFVDWMIKMKPEAVVHFEPVYAHQQANTLWGCMCRRYIEVNDYNRNLWQLLIEAEQEGKIKILHAEKNVYGSNALLPLSVIAWKPVSV